MDEKTFDRLEYLAKNMTSSEVEEFENLLAQYVGRSDEETLKKLLKVFDDQCPFYEVMFGLVHLVESWPQEIYIRTLLEQLPVNIGRSSFWMDELFNRIFNHPECLVLFRQNINLAPKETLFKLFNLMEKESPHHHKLIEELRRELEKIKD